MIEYNSSFFTFSILKWVERGHWLLASLEEEYTHHTEDVKRKCTRYAFKEHLCTPWKIFMALTQATCLNSMSDINRTPLWWMRPPAPSLPHGRPSRHHSNCRKASPPN